jgi:serine/threonine-protein kinase
MYRRLHAGEPCSAEQLLAEFPALAADETLALNLVCTEYVMRRQLGQRPSPDEWYARFPQWREQLRQQLRVDGAPNDCTPTLPATEAELAHVTASDPVTTPPLPAPTLARYELLEKLQVGGMGVVYRVRDTVLGREVALKMIRGGPARDDEVLRFRREAQAVAQLRHRHIVPLYDFGEHDGQPFFTMAYVAGGSLAQHLDRYTGDARTAVELMEKVARAVQAAHDKGIIHRDLKPANVLLDEEGEPLVSDFGLAKFLDADADPTHSGQLVGTPAYMAPEQAAGHANKATAQSDVWSLGVMLYELLTGRRPFPGKGQEAVQHVLGEEPPPLRALRPQLDRPLETVALRCLEKEPARRYGSARELADDLARWLRGEPIAALPEPWRARLLRTVRRHPLVPAAVLVLLLTAAATAIALYYADPERQLKTIQRQVAGGQAVTLIGDTGRPRWSRWSLSEGGVIRPPLGDGTFSIQAFELSLLELLPNPPRQGYVFSADVRHLDSSDGEVGIYFGHGRRVTSQGAEHCFCQLAFADLGLQARHVALTLRSCREQGPLPPSRAEAGTPASMDLPPPGPDDPMPWRRLTVKFSPQGVEALLGDHAIGRLSRSQLTRDGKRALADDPELDPASEFAAEGGLGLYVNRGAAEFRRVVVEPFKEP